MNCQQFLAAVHAYIDGELDVPGMLMAESHVAGCEQCASQVAHLRSLGSQLREAMTAAAPASLRSAAEGMVAAAIAEHARRRTRRRRWVASVSALAAVLAVGVALYACGLFSPASLDDDDIREVAALQIRSQLPGHLLDLPSSDVGAIASWFSKQLTFTPWLRGFGGHGYELAGARLDFCDNQRVAVLVYRHGDQIANLVIYPAEKPGDRPPLSAASNDIHICGWTRHGMQYFLASQAPAAELATFPGTEHM